MQENRRYQDAQASRKDHTFGWTNFFKQEMASDQIRYYRGATQLRQHFFFCLKLPDHFTFARKSYVREGARLVSGWNSIVTNTMYGGTEPADHLQRIRELVGQVLGPVLLATEEQNESNLWSLMARLNVNHKEWTEETLLWACILLGGCSEANYKVFTSSRVHSVTRLPEDAYFTYLWKGGGWATDPDHVANHLVAQVSV
jgi:hypothetical protein